MIQTRSSNRESLYSGKVMERQRLLARVSKQIAMQWSMGDDLIPKAPEEYIKLYMDFLNLEVKEYL